MAELLCYKTMPEWHAATLPEAFTRQHNTQPGSWAKLTLLSGSVDFAFLTAEGETVTTHHFTPIDPPPLIEPQRWHRIVSCSADMRCQLAFYCSPEDYYHQKYGLTRPHSDVVGVNRLTTPGQALDVGCGGGRNALYLQLAGHDVTAWDKNPQSVASLNDIIDKEQLNQIQTAVKDLNLEPFSGEYDVVFSTVVMMFLDPQQVPRIIRNMQDCTRPGGLNLIVSAMDSQDYPCPLPFPFLLTSGQLREYYRGWDIIKYNEDLGQLHKTDAEGNRISLRFATLIARKAV
ncbi:SAM-dependent methyltransferase TehB [Biostraticola tofi]|uniref:Tellurite methyltransferase n=1 Tax=Biostraticola tofi TaxID=466109 RepID=A0A4V2W4C1_9GAMM|nr:SAM-dependent methyltransferase TehB [Biostraticola tofi]TCV95229.1 tellurite methyltransferase [Biostraticola tofi]